MEVENAWLVEGRGSRVSPQALAEPEAQIGCQVAAEPDACPNTGTCLPDTKPGSGSPLKLSPSQRKWATNTQVPPNATPNFLHRAITPGGKKKKNHLKKTRC